MPCGKLFLLGGGISVFDLMADAFLAEAGGARARLAILLIGGEGWERHRPGYAAPWERRGLTGPEFVVPGPDGLLNTAQAVEAVNNATGIILGGGDTREYHRLYATEPMSRAIRERVRAGVPYAGLSAGALLTPDTCVVRPRDGEPHPTYLPGLGLLPGVAMGVHYDRPGQAELLQQAMAYIGVAEGLGLDEGACAVLRDGELVEVFGAAVHRVAPGGE